MALGNISGIAYVVPDDPGHPDVLPEDTKGIAKSIAARLREWGLRLNERVDTLASRVDAMAVATGVAAGSPDDGKVAAFILDTASNTRAALNGVVQSILDTALEALPETGALRVEDFGAVCDGVTDDTAALRAGLAESARLGVPLHLPARDTIALVGQVNIPVGASIHGHSATLSWAQTTGAGTWLLNANYAWGSEISDLSLVVETSATTVQRGFTAVGAGNLTVRNLAVKATTPGAGSGSANENGARFEAAENVSVTGLSVEGFDYAVRVKGLYMSEINGFEVKRYRTGLYVTDTTYCAFRNGDISIKGPNTTQDDGHNGVLIDATGSGLTDMLTLEDVMVADAGATGFRLGGQNPVTRVGHVRCVAVRCGSNGFKTLGGTVSSGSRHRYIRYVDCTALDVGLGGGTNSAGVAVHLSDDVVVSGLTVGTSTVSGYSCRDGVYVAGSSRVRIIAPDIRRPTFAGIAVRSALGEVSDVSVLGGKVATVDGANAFDFGWEGTTFRRISVEGTKVEHYGTGYVIHARKDSSSSLSGPLSVEVALVNSGAITNMCTGSGREDVSARITGPVPSDMSYTGFKNGSRWWSPDGTLGLRQGGAWRWL